MPDRNLIDLFTRIETNLEKVARQCERMRIDLDSPRVAADDAEYAKRRIVDLLNVVERIKATLVSAFDRSTQ